ncbi:MAG: glycosyltransferase family A protein [Planctomycetota bacterium]
MCSMQSIGISIIIPTLGRATLQRALESVVPYLESNDEILVVADGVRHGAQAAVEQLNSRQIRYFEHSTAGSTFGNAQRNFAMHQAKGDYFAFLDDDDRFLPNALSSIRREACHKVPLIFRREYHQTFSWSRPEFIKGEVGTGMFATPVKGPWVYCPLTTNEPGFTDFVWIQQVVSLWPPNSLRWCEDIIYWCKGHGHGQ